jgi:hypothetical protein
MYGDEITADFETLLRQAWKTADMYMTHAVDCIDGRFGEGFAKAHPELVGAFMRTAASDLSGAIVAQQLRKGFEDHADIINQERDDILAVAKSIDRMANAVRDLGN